MFVLCCPTYKRYDTCVEMLRTAYLGERTPDYTVILDNGGSFSEYIANVNATGFFEEVAGINIEVVTAAYNLGVARSWNTFLQSMNDEDVLLVVNDDVTFERNTLSCLLEAQAANPDALMIVPQTEVINAFSCFVVTKKTLDTVGMFDEGFYPAYFEDNDYGYRMQLLGHSALRVDCPIGHVGSATLQVYTEQEMNEHHENFRRNEAYYLAKWGGMPGHEAYTVPFDGGLSIQEE